MFLQIFVPGMKVHEGIIAELPKLRVKGQIWHLCTNCNNFYFLIYDTDYCYDNKHTQKHTIELQVSWCLLVDPTSRDSVVGIATGYVLSEFESQ
jgi:hypothetical protein